MDKIFIQYGEQLKNNRAIILAVAKNYDKALAYANEDVLNDDAFVLSVVTMNGATLHFANESQKNNETIVLAAINKNGKALKYASDTLKNNEKVVMAAIKNNGNALQFANEPLKLNRSIVLEAVKNGCAIAHIPMHYLRDDEEIISMIIDRPKELNYSLALANESIRNNRSIVMKAVRKNGLQLAYANPILQSDVELAKAAANQNFLAFEHTTLHFSDIKEMILEVFKGNQFRWYYKVHHSSINNSRYSLLAAVYCNVFDWNRANDKYKNDKELMIFAIELDAKSFNFASDALKKDKEVVMAALTHDDYNRFIIDRYIDLFCTWFKNDEEVLNKIASKTGLELKILENYEQYKNAKTIMEKWFCELPPKTKNSLKKCKSLYYPGAYHDFSTLQFFLENSSIKNFYYTDYMNKEINQFSILDALQSWFNKWDGYQITQHINIHPSYFHEDEWDPFWHADPQARFGSDETLSFCVKFNIEKDEKSWNLYYFGTEGIATYDVLLKNKITMDVVVTQDHGLGGCWTSFCEGSLLEKVARNYKKLPKIILSGGEAWKNYTEASDWFGKFGMHEGNRKLFELTI